MPAKRKLPPEWWLLGYLAQYQRQTLVQELGVSTGLSSDAIYAAAHHTAIKLPSQPYRRLSKAWAVRQLRARETAK